MKKLRRIRTKLNKISSFLKEPLRERIKSKPLRQRTKYAGYYKRLRLKENVILYEAFSGRGMLCNPYAIFQYLLTSGKYENHLHIWVLDDVKKHSGLMKSYRRYKNVRFIQYQSSEYLKYLCLAKYVINNSTFPPYFTKKEGQVYINTWHGVPLKKIGFDMPDGSVESCNVVRNLLHTDYLLSTGPMLTRMYTDAYKLTGIYSGRILEYGYPRLDLLKNADRSDVLFRLAGCGVSIEPEKQIILYAPTWRGASFGSASTDIDAYFRLKEYFDAHVDTSKYQLLIKVHQIVYAKLGNDAKALAYMVPATMDANEILSVTDILISDYSSIFFDFLATGRPVIFYVPDNEGYQSERGTYFDLSRLPGSRAADMETLCDMINRGSFAGSDNAEYRALRQACCGYEIGAITPQVADAIFEGREIAGRTLTCQNEKTKLLFVRTYMRANGMSTSLLNLLKQIDYDKYDVSVQVLKPTDPAEAALIDRIPPKARVLVRTSTLNVTLPEDYCQRLSSNYGIRGKYARFYRPEIFRREFERSYGGAHFDVVINFEGYNTYFSLIHLAQPDSRKCLFMHNDMHAEMKLKYPALRHQFQLFPMFDSLISCSKAIMEVNRKNLATKETYARFTYAKNMLDYQRVLTLSEERQTVEIDGIPHFVLSSGQQTALKRGLFVPLAPPDVKASEGQRTEQKVLRFITLGRLSPEKNHHSLLSAFRRFCDDGYAAMLYILGDGPQKKTLEGAIASLKLQNRVILTGNVHNPFGFMKECDCFILPSLHEGQPMVILEARTLHMPVIMTEFSSAGGVMLPNGQFLVDKSADGIYQGLVAFAEGRVPSDYTFDTEQYNREAYEEFLCAIGEKK